jgi:hypothetical protein
MTSEFEMGSRFLTMRALAAGVVSVTLTTMSGCDSKPKPTLTRAEMLDPAACKDCHPKQYTEWSGSMHAYASEDPVFLAMNARGQRETQGALGTFCVKCHAPMAVEEGSTADGLNLGTLGAPLKNVTCYFCHAAHAVDPSMPDNNPLILTQDNNLFGPFADAVAETPHQATYSTLFDSARLESAAACGTCHDIVNQHGAAIERTYKEWQGTLFADPKTAGLTCASNCHMALSDSGQAPASTISPERKRDLHDHSFPGVDVALTAFPEADTQKQGIQALLDATMHTTLCLDATTRKIWVILDNAGAGHGFPSGATQDRRAWVEVTATLAGQVIYQSGVPPAGQTIETAPDPDLWLIRDCIFGDDGKAVNMFWQAASYRTNQLPGSVMPVVTDPTSFNKTHIKRIYPGGTTTLSALPDRISIKVHIQPIGDDVLQDLIASGDLDATVAAQIPSFTLGNGGTLEWTSQANMLLPGMGDLGTCVQTGTGTLRADTTHVDTSTAACTQ